MSVTPEKFARGDNWLDEPRVREIIDEVATKLWERVHRDFPRPNDREFGYIPKEAIDPLTSLFVAVIAEVIQGYIDAGSEREVTFENEQLYEAIYSEFRDWSNAHEDFPAA